MMLERAKSWAKNLKRDIGALWLAARDPRTPRLAKILAIAVVAYALSPIDLIPDFVPVLGMLDDIIIVPLGILLLLRLLPVELMQELRAEAARLGRLPASRAGMLGNAVIWVIAALALALWLTRWLS
jgi:uncharacterized membrane protein YkvA (DUF1232 family)